MKIKQLGNAGGLNIKTTSTSFLLKYNKEEFILIDSGHRVLEEANKSILEDFNIKDNLNLLHKINGVCITHTHMDHISDLETIIYNNYFLYNQKIDIYTSKNVVKDLKKFLPNDNLFKDWKIKKDKKYKLHKIDQIKDSNINKNIDSWFRITDELYINSFKTFHPGIESTGSILMNGKTKNCIMITGDTKSISLIEKIHNKLEKVLKYNCVKIYHDYSNWDNSADNIHACQSDINIYDKKFREKLTFVHNEKDFDKSWIEF